MWNVPRAFWEGELNVVTLTSQAGGLGVTGPFNSSSELCKTLTLWEMPEAFKKEIFQEGKDVIITVSSTFAFFP